MKLGLIGCGKMGGALLEGVIQSNLVQPDQVILFDTYQPAVEAYLAKFTGSHAVANPNEMLDFADVIILAVKPKDMAALCKSMCTHDRCDDALFLSIAAGITLEQLTSWFGRNSKVIRVMPNTPAQVGKGYTAIARGANVSDEGVLATKQIFEAVGLVDEVPENLMNAITGLSGSGPAYIFTIIEALADGGVLMGLPRDVAVRAAAQTVLGSSQMVIETQQHTGILRDAVTSPGGTTIAGLEQLEEHGLRNALLKAVRKATERSEQLAKS